MSSDYHREGYHKLAEMMGQSNDLAIFRKFGDLNVLSLMSYQAELIELRDEFYSICKDDFKSGKDFALDFQSLFSSRASTNDFQYTKLMEIRAKIHEYIANISKLESPPTANLKCLQEWLRDSQGGKNFLKGSEAFTWHSQHKRDLVGFGIPLPDQDMFTEWIASGPVSLYHRILGHKRKRASERVVDEETGLIDYGKRRLNKATKVISTTIASTIPMLIILGLYFEKDLLKRIYISIGISAVFAAVLSMFTDARRIEVFAATIALAAVEAVFIGSADSKD
ncbi:uncharacterized protein BDR25DRAFT_226673 [Lindgomyces ingoldianus]|uniref:Uncharacterized protein n=1 Tax=Lindgomyces ingoldianus TaxID=673940 RepID=A0ACB6QT05_9PLEO|nr:uncharacterized protein BDR25DRAFT_226673 [Lindgomyces ingoldianus]KAF2470010.1 hypothetical protein BDR25DRAFT_226673 [Lindgomyces ingoldianus]